MDHSGFGLRISFGSRISDFGVRDSPARAERSGGTASLAGEQLRKPYQFKRNPATAEDNRNVKNDDDFWGAFMHERREIADFIRHNKISGVCILHDDAHMLAADDGRHSDYATGGGARFPVLCAAPLDQTPSIKGGPYSQGVYKARAGEGCFGYVQVRDDGAQIKVQFSGRNNLNEEKISLKFSVP